MGRHSRSTFYLVRLNFFILDSLLLLLSLSTSFVCPSAWNNSRLRCAGRTDTHTPTGTAKSSEKIRFGTHNKSINNSQQRKMATTTIGPALIWHWCERSEGNENERGTGRRERAGETNLILIDFSLRNSCFFFAHASPSFSHSPSTANYIAFIFYARALHLFGSNESWCCCNCCGCYRWPSSRSPSSSSPPPPLRWE